MKLNTKAFGLAFGLLCGFGLFFGTLWMIIIGKALGAPTLISKCYIVYSITPIGSLVGLVWAFFDGLIGGAIFAWLYNKLSSREK